ncbi:polysaccharide deacetylase family protein [Candidatus Bathyarchaeota archaeon]|nr:polysaccharide deacetylase family protein [Candidatus Bathyarchaeota archaeon]
MRSVLLMSSHRNPSAIEKALARCVLLAREFIYFVLYAISRLSRKHEVSILAYHSVGSNGSFYTTSLEEFGIQIEYLRKVYNIVSLDDILEFALGRKSLPNRSVAITFDDGYYDSYLNVFPCVKRFDLPVTVFVATGYVGGEMLLDNVSLKVLSWDEIVEMSRSKVTIGAHTRTHIDLQQVDLEEAKREILGSREEIEKKIRRPVRYFAYPMGKHDDRIVEIVSSLGFNAAFCGEGLIHQGDNPYLLNRITVNAATTFSVFRARLTMATEWYKRIEHFGKMVICALPILSCIDRVYRDRKLARTLHQRPYITNTKNNA